nr:ras-related protein Rab-44 isoform X1 [Vanessa tameamea]
MRDDEPPLLAAPIPGPQPSRLKRTLQTLRSPFRSGAPFHIASLKRTGSSKSSVSDSEIARDERTMRKKNKKLRAESADASRSTDSSPIVEKKKSTGLLKRMGSIGKRRGESSTTPSLSDDPGPEPEQGDQHEVQVNPLDQDQVLPKPELDTTVESEKQEQQSTNTTESKLDSTLPEPSASPEPPFIPIAVEHPVAMRAFTKEAWKRRRKTEIVKPVEEPSPGDALKRRIAFVAQASVALSEDRDDDEDEVEEGGGEVGTLEAAVLLARQRLAMAAHSPAPPHSSDNNETEEEGCADTTTTDAADTMPAYGDLIEPENKADNDDVPPSASAGGERREHLYKILVIGELGTGKTSIIKRYVHQFFSQHYRATIGVDFALKVLNWDANTVIRLQLWDIAGQERFGNMTRVYYKEAVGAFIVFDVSRVATFDAVVKWKNDLDTKVQLPDGSPIPCILLANKCDQQKEGIVNSPAKMDEYCREKGFAGWFETSAKENINIEDAARSLVNKILLNDKLLQSSDKDGDGFALDHKIANGENNRDTSSSKSCSC